MFPISNSVRLNWDLSLERTPKVGGEMFPLSRTLALERVSNDTLTDVGTLYKMS